MVCPKKSFLVSERARMFNDYNESRCLATEPKGPVAKNEGPKTKAEKPA